MSIAKDGFKNTAIWDDVVATLSETKLADVLIDKCELLSHDITALDFVNAMMERHITYKKEHGAELVRTDTKALMKYGIVANTLNSMLQTGHKFKDMAALSRTFEPLVPSADTSFLYSSSRALKRA